ncbi:MarR family winged helix-turn-helix transcriptional regulator [Streptomyces sp. KLOTTS4A1]|uniref:MarR family winged helix-turn-helix transcriptional regulator n=1 Tax=Streptomyces sp. KLOTTS4A1 TaxID=3390996 RepID=UPI0039F496CB
MAAESELSTGVLLFIPYRALEDRVFAALAEAGYDDLTPAQARVMQRIAPDGIRLTELAAQAQITKQTAGFLVDQLEKAGYVERVPDPTDRRARLIRGADRAWSAKRVADAVVAEEERKWEAHLGPRRMRQLRESLALLREITDPWA